MFRRYWWSIRKQNIQIPKTVAQKEQQHNNQTSQQKCSCLRWTKLFISALTPLTIGIFTIVTTIQERHRLVQDKQQAEKQQTQSKDTVENQRLQEKQLANDLQQESVFTTYIEDISKFILNNRNDNTPFDDAQSLLYIRTKTLTVLRKLDPQRKKNLMLFLIESRLINTDDESKDLDLSGADFSNIHFNGTMQSKCKLESIYLPDVYLINASFLNCRIIEVNFTGSYLMNTKFTQPIIENSIFKNCVLDESGFTGTELFSINFANAFLPHSDFTAAFNVRHPDFTNADLTNVTIADEHLKEATLYNAILPNKTFGPIQSESLVVNGDAEYNVS
ncbi:unnamed protein product [Didymodactylos carnosus]|uniref:Pentapeptide repeat-containing protein n=1 Tax=Didymodactylos carnosus TaxID=1234261 RepID=A0A815R7Z8_9BILA|nr:unnamed protein product [Didymodactylos carnosus]CAF1473170.1 unnamed protein product [Didymodactylos carnosus]CAF4017487.1 unnamed protein product [Didymodactylos carnosus]CAF4340203.1 unnamed protein product [Didymodactylos carnosus]